jgi:hypothetical protein
MSVVAQPPRPLSRQESLPEGEPGAPTAFGFDYADVDFGTPSTISFGAFSPELPQTDLPGALKVSR